MNPDHGSFVRQIVRSSKLILHFTAALAPLVALQEEKKRPWL